MWACWRGVRDWRRGPTGVRCDPRRTARGLAPMARVTVEDCIEKVPNRFHLVQMASVRTKQLKKGARALVGSEGNKEVVVSLREIAAGFIKPDYPEEEGPGSPA